MEPPPVPKKRRFGFIGADNDPQALKKYPQAFSIRFLTTLSCPTDFWT
jgi:hypothetical protein